VRNNLSVKQLNKYVKDMFDDELVLQGISVFGEVFQISVSGKCTFLTLKEEDAVLPCLSFKHFVLPKVGDKVLLTGSVSFNQKSAKYSFLFDECKNIGEGIIQSELLKRKEKLKALGYFDKKTDLPRFIKSVCIITSSRGSVIHDFLSGLSDGHAYIDVTVYPCAVQGQMAEVEIADNVTKADKNQFDAIVIARGGGSAVDLECFNSETVAIAVGNANTPIISAVGHETDYTLCDHCASYRAGTPSFAAKLITENNQLLIDSFFALTNRMNEALTSKSRFFSQRLGLSVNGLTYAATELIDRAGNKLRMANQKAINTVESKQDKLFYLTQKLSERAKSAITNVVNNEERRFIAGCTQLEYLNPLKALSLGYAILSQNDNEVKSIYDVETGKNLDIILHDGRINTTVISKEDKNGF